PPGVLTMASMLRLHAPTLTLPRKRRMGGGFFSGLIQPQVGDVFRVGLQFALLDPQHDVGQDRIGRRRNPDLLALSDDIAVEERNLGATALDHVLAGRWTVLATTAIRHGHAMLVDFLLRRRIALAGPRQHLRVQMADLVKGIAERLADPDRLAAEPVREMPQR